MALLALPRRIGKHPLTDKVVNAGIGRFGPYVTHDKVFGSFDKKTHTYDFNGETFNVLNITMDAAVELLRNTKKRAAPTPLRELGNHPEDDSPIQIFEGKFGPYIKHGPQLTRRSQRYGYLDGDYGRSCWLAGGQSCQRWWKESRRTKGNYKEDGCKEISSHDHKKCGQENPEESRQKIGKERRLILQTAEKLIQQRDWCGEIP
jgi:hypothetical protein